MQIRWSLVLLAGLFCSTPDSQAQSTSTGAMNLPRYQHTATLLNNGLVLVTGGNISTNGINNYTGTAEIYNPQTGTWRYTGLGSQTSMNFRRAGHTATLLSDGRVLIAGGAVGAQYNSGVGGVTTFFTNSVDIFDPATETFTPTGPMVGERRSHSAILLKDGRVLVLGGWTDGYSYPQSEIYNPATQSWTALPNVQTHGYSTALALLPNGKVLGAGGGYPTNIVDLFDPASNTWQAMTPLLNARSGATAFGLPNGQVFVAGGVDNTAELYDVTANSGAGGSVLVPGSLTVGSNQSAVQFSNGNVLLASGQTNDNCGTTTPNVQLYNYASNSLSPQTPLLTSRLLFPMTLLQNAQVLSAGGLNVQCSGTTVLNQAELWGTSSNSTGTITVNTNLSAAAFTITGPATYSGGGLSFTQSSAPGGTYQVTYALVPGYITPLQQSLLVSSGPPATVYGIYALRTGSLTISSTLPGTTLFTVSGPAGFSGLIGTTPLTYILPIGSFIVSFAPAQGYITPTPQPVSVLEATSMAVSGNYVLSPGTGTVVITLNSPYAGFDMTGPLGFSGVTSQTFKSAPPGLYHVQFLPGISSGLPKPPSQDKMLFANETLLFSAKNIPSSVPIKVVPLGICNPYPPGLSFGGDVCISFEAKPGAPTGRLRGIVHIINGTGAWYSAAIVRVVNSVAIVDQQIPSVFLLPPRGANGFFDSSSDSALYVEFGLGDSLVFDLQRDSIEAAGAFSIDFLSRVFLGSDLPAFSSKGFLSLVAGGVIPAALDTIKSECANSFFSFLYGSTNPATDWNDLGSTLTCIAKDDLAKGAFLRMLDNFVSTQQKSVLVGVMDKVGDFFSFASYFQHAVSATEAFGGYYAAPVHGQIRLDGLSRGQ